MDLHRFQKQYALSNKDMAEVCLCSLPTIQKWRSGEVTPSGSARQLIKFLDFSADGNPAKLREILSKMNRSIGLGASQADDEIQQLESSMTKVMDRLELMLESRRKEKALAESEARYRSMVESQDDPVCRWKTDTTLTFVNEAYARLYSEFGTDLIGRKWLDFIPPERRSYVETLVNDMVRRGEPEVLNHESVDKDGQIHFQEWRDIPIRNERGDVVEFHSVGRDKTELVMAQKRLKELDGIVNALMKACGKPVVVFNPDGTLLQWNDEFKDQMLGHNGWSSLGDLFPSLEKRRFNRLLERLSDTDYVVYRVQFEQIQMLLSVRSIRAGEDGLLFLGVFEETKEITAGDTFRVRLDGEIIIDESPVDPLLSPSEEKAIKREVEAIAEASRVDRIYVFLFDDKNEVTNNVIEWCADGVESQIDELQRIPFSEYGWWIKRLKSAQWINIEDTSKMPRTAIKEQKILQAQGIASVIVAPLEVNKQVIGFVGFDQNSKPRLWHSQEIDLLKDLKGKTERHLEKSL